MLRLEQSLKNGNYNMVVAPEGFPGKLYRNRYCYEHHMVYWEFTGRTVADGECIHHVNGDKRDNRIDNLELKNKSEHTSSHSKKPETVVIECAYCGNDSVKMARNVRSSMKSGQVDFYCDRSCAARHFGRGRSKK
jgi:hypothetical protein